MSVLKKITTYKLIFILVLVTIMPVLSFTIAKEAKAACQNSISDAIILEVINTRTGQQILNGDEDIQIGDVLHVSASTSPDPNGGYVVSGGLVRSQFGTYNPSPAPHHEVSMYNGYDYAIETDLTVVAMPDYIYVHIDGTCLVDHEQAGGDAQIDFGQSVPDFDCAPITPLTQIDPGTDATLGVHTDPVAGFASNVNYNITISADPGTPNINPPALGAITGNNQTPPSNTTVAVTTTGTTTPGSYTVHFDGTGGGQSHNCLLSLRVNPAEGGFDLEIAPHGGPSNPVKSLIGNDVVFDVFATCYGGFSGPIINMAARTDFTSVNVALGQTRLDCGESTTVTISNTQAIPASQQSTIPDPINLHPEDVVVSGNGQL